MKCERCSREITEGVRLTVRQLNNPVTVLRLICARCLHDFSSWWVQGVTDGLKVVQ